MIANDDFSSEKEAKLSVTSITLIYQLRLISTSLNDRWYMEGCLLWQMSFFILGDHQGRPYIYNNTQKLYMVICHFLWFGA